MAIARRALRLTAPAALTYRTLVTGTPYRALHASARHDASPSLTIEGTETTAAMTPSSSTPDHTHDGWLYVDSVFPIRISKWDPRHYIGRVFSETLLSKLQSMLSSVDTHGFTITELEPHPKDGGVFVHFKYNGGGESQAPAALRDIKADIEKQVVKEGGIPNWLYLRQGNVWLVKGRPWKEDLHRYPSSIVKVAFDGPDVQEEPLYNLFRPYGRISDLISPPPPPAGALRTATVTFRHLRAATIARNVVHGLDFAPDSIASGGAPPRTRLRTAYQPPVQAHAIRDFAAKHPRITAPILLFLIGTLTYTVFDPIRAVMVEGKILDWFDYHQYDIYQWLERNMASYLPFLFTLPNAKTSAPQSSTESLEDLVQQSHEGNERRKGNSQNIWQERQDAEASLQRYLNDMPSTVTFVHGPQGSGKTRMLFGVLENAGRKTLIIDCAQLLKGSSDSSIVNSLAQQTGYWPVFTFLNQFNTWIDMASVGLIGQKAGLATSLPDQVEQVLTVVGAALGGVSKSYRSSIEKRVRSEQMKEKRREEEAERHKQIETGEWHDGRLDNVSGNGLISEVGIGDERIEGYGGEKVALVKDETDKGRIEEQMRHTIEEQTTTNEREEEERQAQKPWLSRLPSLSEISTTVTDALPSVSSITHLPNSILDRFSSENKDAEDEETKDPQRKGSSVADLEAVNALPILILKNYGSRFGSHKDADEVLGVVAKWAAGLTENKTAHVIVMSDNRENSKRLAKALPSKPLNSIALYDADTNSALSYVKQKLHDAGIDVAMDNTEASYVDRLGGRASDLESLVHKVRNGNSIPEALEDIIVRDIGEVRKNAFGDDADDAKGLPWSREQAWQLFKRLVKNEEVAYYDVLTEVFKNDETALRNLEHAELIAITTNNGRPSGIRPGKPVYKYVFQRLVSDSVFHATLDLAVNEQGIASSEKAITTIEDELLRIKQIDSTRTTRKRENYLLGKMQVAQDKIVALDKANIELKKVLAKGG